MIALDTNVLARFYCDDPEDPESVRQRPIARRIVLESRGPVRADHGPARARVGHARFLSTSAPFVLRRGRASARHAARDRGALGGAEGRRRPPSPRAGLRGRAALGQQPRLRAVRDLRRSPAGAAGATPSTGSGDRSRAIAVSAARGWSSPSDRAILRKHAPHLWEGRKCPFRFEGSMRSRSPRAWRCPPPPRPWASQAPPPRRPRARRAPPPRRSPTRRPPGTSTAVSGSEPPTASTGTSSRSPCSGSSGSRSRARRARGASAWA